MLGDYFCYPKIIYNDYFFFFGGGGGGGAVNTFSILFFLNVSNGVLKA